MNLLRLSLVLAFFGCATMNQSECLNADWFVVGLEDGSRGYPVSQIGKHRKACAEHQISPDFSQYEKGHSDGLQLFCTERNGFLLGNRGGQYSGVCPPDIEPAFLNGYQSGQELFTASKNSKQAASALKSLQEETERLRDQISRKEQLLVSDQTSEANRLRLLEDIRADENKLSELETKLTELEQEQADKQYEYERLKNLSDF
ncbi:MAG: DUF2799 domain-containing protein [Deltaproteobacteria bacterium]|jgi:hypothetical protein|nr:DUF2799 domain-containing protein [Deltaproteobacteria bacterium]